jgi:predicted AlkP superfamily phosphohydrolase/phosphomutase
VVRINLHLEALGHLVWRPSDGSAAAERRDMANFANLDWSRTRAFCPTPSSNGVVIRRKSVACPAGVAPEDYESFREMLIAQILDLRDPETGLPVVKEVLRREEAFPGAAMEHCPDLTLILADHGFVSVRNREPAVVTRPVPLGTHHPDGIFIMAGKGVRPSGGWDAGGRLSIVDVTAITAHSMGLPVPADFEGTVPTRAYEPDWLAAHPVVIGAAVAAAGGAVAEPAPVGQSSSTEDEQREEMLAQLRLLGYIED